MQRRSLLFGAALAVITACGASSSPSGEPGADAGSSTASDITAFQQLAGDTASAARAYRVTITGPSVTTSSCMAIHDQYDAQVRVWVAQMTHMAGGMDGFIDSRGGSSVADLQCVSATMLNELDYHRSVACTFADISADQAEAVRHADAMSEYAGHAWNRCDEMLTYGAGGQWGPMMNGCQAWSTTCCSGMMHWGCCGGMMGGGGSCCGSVTPDGGSTNPVALGQRIFDEGIGIDGKPIPYSGGMPMRTSCAGCHGYDGHGRRMMMFTTPNITYANLTNPSGMREPDGTHGPTYTDALIEHAIESGIDSNGDALSTWMPRWQLQDAEWADLLAYLETLP